MLRRAFAIFRARKLRTVITIAGTQLGFLPDGGIASFVYSY